MKKRILVLLILVVLFLESCSLSYFSQSESIDALVESEGLAANDEQSNEVVEEASGAADVGEEKLNEQMVTADEKEPQVDAENVVINPLTGLAAANPENLTLPPALVSITNFPPTARPQFGLSFSPIVFELFIGDGMTRYLALFYGDYPVSEILSQSGATIEETVETPEAVVGPVRSGRIPYEHIRKLYNGFIVMASAYSKVADQLNEFVNVFGSDRSDVNSAMIPVTDLEEIARANDKALGENALGGMEFDESVPTGGKDAQSLWLYYSFKNQVFWRYDSEDGAYHRWQDDADGVTFIEQTDRLNGNPLTYENVIILLVDHTVEQKYYIDLDLLSVRRDKALIFRDGEVHTAYWTTYSGEYEQTTGKLRPIRFVDAEGNPFPLKPGQTWIELIPTHSPIWETEDSEKYHILLNGRNKGSGHWAVYFKTDN